MIKQSLLALMLFSPLTLRGQGPAVGDMAPDFTLTVAGKAGVEATPLTLSSLRGKPVVLAFFPRARTSGCTYQMKAYRDRFSEIFPGAHLIAISTDSASTLASWAADESFPFRFAADIDKVAGNAYGTTREGRATESRVLFVIDAEGRVSHVMRPFLELDPTAYDRLKQEIAAVRPK
jgi:peroxiredoxin Q/BCP